MQFGLRGGLRGGFFGMPRGLGVAVGLRNRAFGLLGFFGFFGTIDLMSRGEMRAARRLAVVPLGRRRRGNVTGGSDIEVFYLDGSIALKRSPPLKFSSSKTAIPSPCGIPKPSCSEATLPRALSKRKNACTGHYSLFILVATAAG